MLTETQKTMLRLARKAMDQFLPQTKDSASMAQEYAPIMRPWIAGTMEAPASYALNDLCTENGVLLPIEEIAKRIEAVVLPMFGF